MLKFVINLAITIAVIVAVVILVVIIICGNYGLSLSEWGLDTGLQGLPQGTLMGASRGPIPPLPC